MTKERRYYSTKMSQLTLAIGKEPEDYLLERLHDKHSLAKIYIELMKISKKYSLPMMSERGLRLWIEKVKPKKKIA